MLFCAMIELVQEHQFCVTRGQKLSNCVQSVPKYVKPLKRKLKTENVHVFFFY